jgi:hypothetical protein
VLELITVKKFIKCTQGATAHRDVTRGTLPFFDILYDQVIQVYRRRLEIEILSIKKRDRIFEGFWSLLAEFIFYDHSNVGAKGSKNKARNKNFPAFRLVLQCIDLEPVIIGKTPDMK